MIKLNQTYCTKFYIRWKSILKVKCLQYTLEVCLNKSISLCVTVWEWYKDKYTGNGEINVAYNFNQRTGEHCVHKYKFVSVENCINAARKLDKMHTMYVVLFLFKLIDF